MPAFGGLEWLIILFCMIAAAVVVIGIIGVILVGTRKKNREDE